MVGSFIKSFRQEGMKQNISINQLSELSEKGTHRLDIWYHDECDHVCEEVETDIPRHNLPLLSIGQMIEFLRADREFVCIENIELDNGDDSWRISDGFRKSDDVTELELCDALWLVCKEILEK